MMRFVSPQSKYMDENLTQICHKKAFKKMRSDVFTTVYISDMM